MFLYEPPDSDRKIKVQRREDVLSPQADHVVSYLEGQWLPADPKVVQEVLKAVGEKGSGWFDQLQGEPGTFFHCLRAAASTAGRQGLPADPLKALQRLTPSELSDALNLSVPRVHRVEETSLTQARELQRTLLSSKAIDTFAKAADIDREIAIVSAFFNQLGTLLVAWNYPRVYQQVLSLHRRHGASIGEEVKKMFGISPEEIGAHFAQKWHVNPEISRVLTGSIERRPEGAKGAPTLKSLLHYADVFAQAQDTGSFPGALGEWESLVKSKPFLQQENVQKELQGHLETVAALLAAYPAEMVRSLPLVKVRVRSKDEQQKVDARRKRNISLSQLPEALRAHFDEVYSFLEPDGFSGVALRVLFEKAIPAMGFPRGCLFMVSEKSDQLQPLLEVGLIPRAAYKVLVEPSESRISGSLYGQAPLKSSGVLVDGSLGDYVVGPLKKSEYSGVLYLECAGEPTEAGAHDTFVLFNAIGTTLVHCLGR